MKIINLLVICLFISLLSCSKDNTTNNSIKSPFTVKYELICSSSIQTNFLGQQAFIPEIGYTNGTGQNELSNSFTSGTTWSKTITVTDSRRPLTLFFGVNKMILSAAGKVTGNIYIDGKLNATVTNPTINEGTGTLHIGICNMNFTVN